MFIAVDIGNTNVTVGFLKGGGVLEAFKFRTQLINSKEKSAHIIKERFLRLGISGPKVEAVYVCSVVSSLNKKAKGVLESIFKSNVSFIGEDICVPIINRYRIPSQVGQDRLVNAYAGLKLYGKGLIIVDFGTAITFDIVSKKSEYLGGLMFPGLRLMQASLDKGAELLPYVELSRPIELIGRDTVSSIRSGIVFGTASLCDGIISKLLLKECRGFKVLVTGGDAALIKPYSSYLQILEEHLILKGLSLIYKSQKNT